MSLGSMNLHVYIMYYVGMTCLTGAIWTACWYMARALLYKNGNVKLVYVLLKCAMFGYLIPVFFLIKLVHYAISGVTYEFLWHVTPQIYVVMSVLCILWLTGMVAMVAVYVFKQIAFQKQRKARIPASREEVELLQEVQERLHCRRKIRLYHGYMVRSPYVHRCVKPCIYLPMREVSRHDMEIILTHEVLHVKYHDVFWKPVFRFLCCVFWFNPLAWMISTQYGKWAEAHCDNQCYTNYFSPKEYLMLLIQMIQANSEETSLFTPGWHEKESKIVWRANIMDKYLSRKVKAGVSGVVLAGILLVGTVATYAVGRAADQTYTDVYLETADSIELNESDDGLVEYIGDISDLDGCEIIEIVDDSSSKTRAADGNISGWKIKSGSVAKSGTFKKSVGDTIFVAAVITPSDKTVQVGIIYPTGTLVYVQGTGTLSHTFSVPSSGSYAVYIRNVSDTTITANGVYTN